MTSFESKLRRSRKLLSTVSERTPPELPLIVNFSGGKDSMACLLLAQEVSDRVECMYFDSGFELPMTLDYVRERAKELDTPLHVSHPERDRVNHRILLEGCHSLVSYILHYGYFPTAARRWCSTWCKQRPARVYIRRTWGHSPLYKVVGVRAKESQHRGYVYGSAKAQKAYGGKYIRPDNECCGTQLVYPILDWTTDEVVSYVQSKGVELHQGYKLFGVSGCKWCPVHKPETVRQISQVYPGLYDDLVAAEAAINKPAWTHRKVWLRDVVE